MARHFMHDGPAPDSDEAVMISKWRVKASSSPRATLAALSWAADKAGMSYGRFIQGLRPGDEGRIQEEYERFIAERESKSAKRREGRVAIDGAQSNDASVTGGFIISDEDA